MVIAVVAWFCWFTPFDDLLDRSGTPLAGDFIMFYIAGQVVVDGELDQLYDDSANQRRMRQLLPEIDPAESWPYRYPPSVALMMSAFAQLPFFAAASLFLLLQLTLLACSVLIWRNELSQYNGRAQWLWGCAAAPVIIETICGGQLSVLALASVSLAAYALRHQRFVLMGCCLALCLYKPNVLLLPIVACLIAKPKTLLGFMPTVIVAVTVTVLACGWQPLIEYVRLATTLGSSAWSLETPYWKVHGLTPLLQVISPEHGRMLVVILGLLIAVIVGLVWRICSLENDLALGLLLAFNSLFNPYVPIYDLVLLIPATIYLARFAMHSGMKLSTLEVQLVLASLFIGPHLSQMISLQAGFQFFPLCLTCLAIWFLCRLKWQSFPALGTAPQNTSQRRLSQRILSQQNLNQQQNLQ